MPAEFAIMPASPSITLRSQYSRPPGQRPLTCPSSVSPKIHTQRSSARRIDVATSPPSQLGPCCAGYGSSSACRSASGASRGAAASPTLAAGTAGGSRGRARRAAGAALHWTSHGSTTSRSNACGAARRCERLPGRDGTAGIEAFFSRRTPACKRARPPSTRIASAPRIRHDGNGWRIPIRPSSRTSCSRTGAPTRGSCRSTARAPSTTTRCRSAASCDASCRSATRRACCARRSGRSASA